MDCQLSQRLHKSYINKCINGILYLKDISELPVEIIGIIINFYWMLRCEPICYIVTKEGPFLANRQLSVTNMIVNQLRETYPRCHFHVEYTEGCKCYWSSPGLNITPLKNIYFDTIFTSAYFISGYAYESVLQNGNIQLICNKSPCTFYTQGTSYKQIKDSISSWVSDSLNDTNLLIGQNTSY